MEVIVLTIWTKYNCDLQVLGINRVVIVIKAYIKNIQELCLFLFLEIGFLSRMVVLFFSAKKKNIAISLQTYAQCNIWSLVFNMVFHVASGRGSAANETHFRVSRLLTVKRELCSASPPISVSLSLLALSGMPPMAFRTLLI